MVRTTEKLKKWDNGALAAEFIGDKGQSTCGVILVDCLAEPMLTLVRPATVGTPTATVGDLPDLFTSTCTLWPGRVATMNCDFRLVSPFGSMNRRRFRPRTCKIFVTVRRAMTIPSVRSSNVIRETDHLQVRRMDSISATISAAVAAG